MANCRKPVAHLLRLAVTFIADEFMSQLVCNTTLEAEHRIKPEIREVRGMGFVQKCHSE